MMGRGRSTLILFIVFVALASYSYFIEQKRPSRADAESAKERAFSVESKNIAELKINLMSSQTHLENATIPGTLQTPQKPWQMLLRYLQSH